MVAYNFLPNIINFASKEVYKDISGVPLGNIRS